MRKLTLIGAAFCLTLAACAASGVKVTDAQVQRFEVGKTTESEVVATLGQPTTRMRLADGSVMLLYSYAEASVRAASFIPIVGAFAGGSDVRMNQVSLTFAPDGKLKTTSASASQYGSGRGVSAGDVDPNKVPQPRQ